MYVYRLSMIKMCTYLTTDVILRNTRVCSVTSEPFWSSSRYFLFALYGHASATEHVKG